MTPSQLTKAEFRKLLAKAGLNLDGNAFDAAFQGAQHLRDEIARLDRFLAGDTP